MIGLGGWRVGCCLVLAWISCGAAAVPVGYFGGRLSDGRGIQIFLGGDPAAWAGRVQVDGDPYAHGLGIRTNAQGRVEWFCEQDPASARGSLVSAVLIAKTDGLGLEGEIRWRGTGSGLAFSAEGLGGVGRVSRRRGLRVAGRGGSKAFEGSWPSFQDADPLLRAVSKRLEAEAAGGAREFTAGAYGLLWEGLKSGGAGWDWEGSVEVLVVGVRPGWVSLRELRYEYTGGAHGLSHWMGRNFVRVGNTVREPTLADLFRPEAKWAEQLSGLALADLRAQGAAWTLDSTSPEMRVTGFEAKELSSFNLSDPGLLLHFSLYSVAPYSDGLFSVLIPWERIEPMLRDEVRGWLGRRTPAAFTLAKGEPGGAKEVEARVERLIREATQGTRVMERLAFLCDTFGPRLSGSPHLERAIDWVLARLKEDGFENVRGEPVSVPHWVRGEESLEELEPLPQRLPLLGLGGTTNTPVEGISADVLVVSSFAELEKRAAEAKGRMVVFNPPFTEYGDTVRYRSRGAAAAAKVGAIASLIRSVTPFSLRTPHTGMMQYEAGVPRIPHAAITVEDAERLRRLQERGVVPRLRLRLEAKTLPDAMSRNVIAELPGRERPEEVVLVGGHIDSWDVGQGALDDAGGCLAAWEALRLIRETGPAPRRTLRLVLWTNEENGLAGAKAYPARHREELSRHVLAVESDWGIGPVKGFAFTGSERAMAQLKGLVPRLEPIGAGQLRAGAGGSDLGPLLQAGVPVMDLWTDRRDYFWFHHSAADTVDKVDPVELNRCVAALAVLLYSVAEMDETLAR